MNRNTLLSECEKQFKLLVNGEAQPYEISQWAYEKYQTAEVKELAETDRLLEEIFDKLLMAATPANLDGKTVYGREDFKAWWDDYLQLKGQEDIA